MLRAQGARHTAQGDVGQLPPASLGHYAALSFVVLGRGTENGAQTSITFQVITSATSPIVTWSDLLQREKVVTPNPLHTEENQVAIEKL